MPNIQAKLTDEEQYQICQWYAEFKTPTQIQARIKSEFGKDLTLKNVWAYANQTKKWKPMIERLRQEWALGVMDIPLAHKRGRLEELTKLYTRSERNPAVDDYAKVKQCYELLREMRNEMEAGKAEFTNVYLTTIHNYSDEEIVKQRDVVLDRLDKLRRLGLDGKGNGRQATIEADVREAGEEAQQGSEGQEVPTSTGIPGVLATTAS